jgi:hypothetical protein
MPTGECATQRIPGVSNTKRACLSDLKGGRFDSLEVRGVERGEEISYRMHDRQKPTFSSGLDQ